MQICHFSVSAEYSVEIFVRILCRNSFRSVSKVEEGPVYNIDSGLAPKRRRKRSEGELTVVEEPDLAEILKGHIVEGSLDTSQG